MNQRYIVFNKVTFERYRTDTLDKIFSPFALVLVHWDLDSVGRYEGAYITIQRGA